MERRRPCAPVVLCCVVLSLSFGCTAAASGYPAPTNLRIEGLLESVSAKRDMMRSAWQKHRRVHFQSRSQQRVRIPRGQGCMALATTWLPALPTWPTDGEKPCEESTHAVLLLDALCVWLSQRRVRLEAWRAHMAVAPSPNGIPDINRVVTLPRADRYRLRRILLCLWRRLLFSPSHVHDSALSTSRWHRPPCTV